MNIFFFLFFCVFWTFSLIWIWTGRSLLSRCQHRQEIPCNYFNALISRAVTAMITRNLRIAWASSFFSLLQVSSRVVRVSHSLFFYTFPFIFHENKYKRERMKKPSRGMFQWWDKMVIIREMFLLAHSKESGGESVFLLELSPPLYHSQTFFAKEEREKEQRIMLKHRQL